MRFKSHIPHRTCLGCRQRDNKAKLLRVVLSKNDQQAKVVIDWIGIMPGRGAWIHPDSACMSQAISKSSFRRAFKYVGFLHTHNIENFDIRTGQKIMGKQ